MKSAKAFSVCITALSLLFVLPLQAVQRDFNKDPAIVELDTEEDIFALGDIHADPERALGVLRAAKIVSDSSTSIETVEWIAGKSVVVITGDFIDKGPNSLGAIALVRTLQKAAAANGGVVIATMGNHEADFLASRHSKKTIDFRNELITLGIDLEVTESCGNDIGNFLCKLPIAARVNDWFFSHAGNTRNRTLEELKAAIESGFAMEGFASKELIGKNSVLDARLNKQGPNGLAWFYEGKKHTDVKKVLTQYAANLGVNHIVMGHQQGKVRFPDSENRPATSLFQRYGILFLIDSAISKGIGADSVGGALRIMTTNNNNTKVIAICASGEEQVLWHSSKNQDIGKLRCRNAR